MSGTTTPTDSTASRFPLPDHGSPLLFAEKRRLIAQMKTDKVTADIAAVSNLLDQPTTAFEIAQARHKVDIRPGYEHFDMRRSEKPDAPVDRDIAASQSEIERSGITVHLVDATRVAIMRGLAMPNTSFKPPAAR